MQKNFIETEDYWVPVSGSYEGDYYTVAKVIDKPTIPGKFGSELLRVSIFLQDEAVFYQREVYNLLDLVGDMGGVVEIIVIVFGVILYPIAEQAFILKAISELFKARTSDSDLFRN